MRIRGSWKAVLALLVAFALIVAALLWVIITVHAKSIEQEQLLAIAKQNNANGKLLVDCTTPGHECYDRSQKTSAAAVMNINKVTVAAVACSKITANYVADDPVKTLQLIQACTVAALAKQP